MITIIGKPGEPGQLRLTPRPGFKRTHPVLELELVYGHTCPECQNVIQAVFKTPARLDLYPYEETRVMTTSEKEERKGEVIKVFPTEKDPAGSTNYNQEFFAFGADSQQRLVLKNHILRFEAMRKPAPDDKEQEIRLTEPGENCCKLSGVFSLREELMFYDLGLVFAMKPQEIDGYNLPRIADWIPDPKGDARYKKYRWTPAVGAAPPVILMEWEATIKKGYNYWLRELLKPYKKPAVPAA